MPYHHNSIFMTGLTGAAGGWLGAEALRHGTRLTALVRGSDATHARRRVHHALTAAGAAELAGGVEIVSGDLCALDSADAHLIGRLKAADLILHCAARVEFTETADGLLRRTNVEGTRAVLELAERAGRPLVYIGTAYVAGQRTGRVSEVNLPSDHAFNNDYEQSKHQAEAMVRAWSARTGLPALILRPSILLGDWTGGVTTRFNTLYDFMQAFERIAPALGRGGLRVEAAPEATKNFVPLDVFARAAWHLVARGEPGCFHLTHPRPVAITALRDIFARLFGVGRIELVEAGFFERHAATRPERIYQRAVAIYQPYLRGEPAFDRACVEAALAGSGIEFPDLNEAYFARLLAHARAMKWGAPARPSEPHAPPEPQATSPFVDRYFREFLTEKIGRQLLPDLRKLSATVGIALEGDADRRPWILDIHEGALQSVTRNGRVPQCAYRLDTRTFGQIVSGRLEPQRAFFERRVDLEGDMETGLRLAFILAAFFRQYSFEIGED